MAELTKNDWLSALEKAALRAADARIEYGKSIGEKHRPDQREVFFDMYIGKLENEMPFEGITQKDIDRLDRFKSENMYKWLDRNFGGPSPKETEKSIEASKFLPLLQGVAEQGEDWYSMGATKLKGKAAELGYDPGTQEGFMEFLDKVGEYQRDFDNAKNVQEMKQQRLGIPGIGIEFGPKGSAYILGSLTSPSATAGIENAVATGGDLSRAKAAGLAALDVGANTIMFEAPGLNIIKSKPVISSFIENGLQGAGELARQYGASAIDGSIEADPVAALTAASIGATRPAIVSTAAGIASRGTGREAMDFSRGIMRATRAGDPAAMERDGIFKLVNRYNKFVKDGTLVAPEGATKEIVTNLSKKRELLETNKVRDMAKTLGVKPAKDGTYSAEEILKAYDRNFKGVVEITPNGVVQPKVPVSKVEDGEVLLTPLNRENYARFAGQKIADEEGRTPWRTAGLATGRVLGDIGGRVEPIIKVNPFNAGAAVKDYKDQSWYIKLKKANPEAAKVFEEVMKQKDEEE